MVLPYLLTPAFMYLFFSYITEENVSMITLLHICFLIREDDEYEVKRDSFLPHEVMARSHLFGVIRRPRSVDEHDDHQRGRVWEKCQESLLLSVIPECAFPH